MFEEVRGEPSPSLLARHETHLLYQPSLPLLHFVTSIVDRPSHYSKFYFLLLCFFILFIWWWGRIMVKQSWVLKFCFGNSKSTFETKLTNNTQISYHQNNKNKNPNQLIALGITNNE